jgi:3'(2'), 5'-bisphosphate nucleotidase
MIQKDQLETMLPELCALAVAAGERIMQIRAEGVSAEYKEDASPVTRADKEADAMIVARLRQLAPAVPVISEESESQQDISQAPNFWLVDPLDGTKNFIRGGTGFTVNIGLIAHGTPILGVIYLPAQGILYFGAQGTGAFRKRDDEAQAQRITTRPMPAQDRTAIISHDHAREDTAAWLERYGITQTSSASSSLKFCKIAEGEADVYPRTGPTMEWDTAAGHAIVLAAGGSMVTLDEQPFLYGKPQFLNGGFVVCGALLASF